MGIKYDKDIQCKECKSFEVTAKPAGREGLLYCTCICGAKFVAQTDGSDIINRYITSRQKLFAVVEKASLRDGDYSRVGTGLTSLADGFDTIVDIDPMYYWYKLEYVTSGFTDLTKEEAAKTEYGKLSQNRYFISPDDKTRNDIYEKRYAEYEAKCKKRKAGLEDNKRKKRKAIAACVTALVGAAVVGVGAFIGVYRPTVNTEAGVSVTFGNASYGVFDKFRADSEVKALEVGEPDYDAANKLLAEVSPKAKLYSVSLSKGGVKSAPKGKVAYKIKLDESFRKDNIRVYEVSADGSYRPVEAQVNNAGFVTFSSTHSGVFAVAEKPYAVAFDCAGGSGADTCLVPWGESATAPSADKVTRTGYTFAGWLLDGAEYEFTAPVYKDITLTAQWTANNYTVAYEMDGVSVKTEAVTFGEEFTLYQTQKTGYTLGWYYDGEEVKGGTWNIADNATLTAKWTPKTYAVKLESGVEECCQAVHKGTSSVTATYDKFTSSVTVPKRTGYLFDGYYTKPDGEGVKYLDGAGESVAKWAEDKECTLYEKWQLDPEYDGFTYISTVDELYKMANNTAGKYLLTKDLNLEEREWSPLNFNGVFDGGCHTIYNYKIYSGYTYERDKCIGFFGQLDWGGTVRNLQIGKEGFNTFISHVDEWYNWNWHLHAGFIAGFSHGNIINCRVVNCSADVRVYAQDETYKNYEFASNFGGISGVQRGAAISQCSVLNCNFYASARSRYNNISNVARCGGISGYVSDSTITDCLVKNCSVSSGGKTEDVEYNFWYTNKSGQPNALSGGIMGYGYNTTITKSVVYNNKVSAIKSVGENSNGSGARYEGCIIGLSEGTSPSNLIGVNTSMQCSGSDSGYGGFSKISNDSYAELAAKSAAFTNGSWYSDGGKIAVKFFED